MQQQELDTLMQQMFADTKSYAEEQFQISLDGSEASVADVDVLIEKLIASASHDLSDNKVVFTLSNMLGGYVGEIFRQSHGGSWHYDTSDEQAPAVFLLKNEASYAFAGMAFQCLMQNSTLTMQQYYQHAAEQTNEH